jgi:hypothetical protein
VIVDTVLIADLRLARQHAPFAIRLHWLLPDYPWEVTGSTVKLASPQGQIELALEAQDGTQPGSQQLNLARAGELVHGVGPIEPTWGWFSPSYGVKIPALAVIFRVTGFPPVNLVSEWHFPTTFNKETINENEAPRSGNPD